MQDLIERVGMRHKHAYFANFICKFGENKNLIDYFHEIVLPAFVTKGQIRKRGDSTQYLLHKVKLLNAGDLDRKEVVLAGHFVKVAQLTRQQIFRPNEGLIEDHKSLETSPSAFFVLVLDTHRLIYYTETQHAPKLSEFKSSMEFFLRERHKSFLKEISESSESPKSLAELKIEHPKPDLEVIQLINDDALDEFVNRYETLKKVEIVIHRSNDDLDAEEVINDLREVTNEVGAKKSKLIISEKKGLKKAETSILLKSIGKQGNQEISLKGIDINGNELDGSNDKFEVAVHLESMPSSVGQKAKKLFDLFAAANQDGTLPAARIEATRLKSIRSFLSRLI